MFSHSATSKCHTFRLHGTACLAVGVDPRLRDRERRRPLLRERYRAVSNVQSRVSTVHAPTALAGDGGWSGKQNVGAHRTVSPIRGARVRPSAIPSTTVARGSSSSLSPCPLGSAVKRLIPRSFLLRTLLVRGCAFSLTAWGRYHPIDFMGNSGSVVGKQNWKRALSFIPTGHPDP